MSAVALGGGREPGQALRWTAAALLVAGVHAGAGWWLVTHPFAPPAPPEGVAGVTVELEPVSVPVPPTAEPKPMENAGPGAEKLVAEAPDASSEPPPPAVEPPPSPPVTDPPPPVEAAVAPPPEPTPPIPELKPEPAPPPPIPSPVPEVVPPPATVPSDAVLAPPRPPRPVKKVVAPKPRKPMPPKPDPREVARQEAREEARREARAQAAAEARSQRQSARDQTRAARAAAVREGGGTDRESAAPIASGASVSDWQHEVAAHIAAYKPNVQVGSAGTARVTITVDRNGRITSASLSGSSGDEALDQAAVAMMHRASPVPAPPPGSGSHSLGVPVHFH